MAGALTVDGNLAGPLLVPGGCGGNIFVVTITSEGTLGLAEGGAVFSGTATIGNADWGSDIEVCQADTSGTIHVLGTMGVWLNAARICYALTRRDDKINVPVVSVRRIIAITPQAEMAGTGSQSSGQLM